MKKLTLTLIALFFISLTTFAQKGNNQISIGLDAGLPIGDFSEGYNFGFGATFKGLYGIGSAGQLELTTGYLHFPLEGSTSSASGSTAIIPIFAGYRHHLNSFYLEPQVGVSILRSSIDIEGLGSESTSETALGWAVGVGYLFNNFDLSARYQSASKDGNSIGFFAMRIGYNFSW